MFECLPREKPWLSWMYVWIWSLFILVTIPVARNIQRFVDQQWGGQTFAYLVLATIAIVLFTSVVHLRRQLSASRGSYAWLLAVASIFIGYTIQLRNNPEEAIHFVQYGLLGILVYRALTHRFHDLSIYFAAALICGIVGTVDEIIQWITPRRCWALRDIWLNFFAAALVQVGIAKGLKPTIISGAPSRVNLRLLCRLAMVSLVFLCVSLLNTPKRIEWYADRIPWLAFLKENESGMLEYGFLYNDPAIGIFRSRLSPSELQEIDRERGKGAAEILDRYQDRAKYQEFLETYTPSRDPFIHEARVHLFRRDHYFSKSEEFKEYRKAFAKCLTIAFGENQIMAKYFPNTLRHSAYVWSAAESALAANHHFSDEVYDSAVSRGLVTRFREHQIAWFFVCSLLGLALLHWYCGREK